MRIAVISDIHGNSVAMDLLIRDLKKQTIDEIIFLGDLITRGSSPKYVLD